MWVKLVVLMFAVITVASARSVHRRRFHEAHDGEQVEDFSCPSKGYFENPHNCGTFYHCDKTRDGQILAHVHLCAPGTVFSGRKQKCVSAAHSERSNCRAISFQAQSRLFKPIVQDTVWDLSHNGRAQFRTSAGVPCKKQGFTTDTSDCQKFYLCIKDNLKGFIKYTYFCPENTVFERRNHWCAPAWTTRRKECRKPESKLPNDHYGLPELVNHPATTLAPLTVDNMQKSPEYEVLLDLTVTDGPLQASSTETPVDSASQTTKDPKYREKLQGQHSNQHEIVVPAGKAPIEIHQLPVFGLTPGSELLENNKHAPQSHGPHVGDSNESDYSSEYSSEYSDSSKASDYDSKELGHGSSYEEYEETSNSGEVVAGEDEHKNVPSHHPVQLEEETETTTNAAKFEEEVQNEQEHKDIHPEVEQGSSASLVESNHPEEDSEYENNGDKNEASTVSSPLDFPENKSDNDNGHTSGVSHKTGELTESDNNDGDESEDRQTVGEDEYNHNALNLKDDDVNAPEVSEHPEQHHESEDQHSLDHHATPTVPNHPEEELNIENRDESEVTDKPNVPDQSKNLPTDENTHEQAVPNFPEEFQSLGHDKQHLEHEDKDDEKDSDDLETSYHHNHELHVSDPLNIPEYHEEHFETGNKDENGEPRIPEDSQNSEVESETGRDADKHKYEIERSQDNSYTPEKDENKDSHVSGVPHYSEENVEFVNEDKNEELDVPEDLQGPKEESKPELDTEKHEYNSETSQDHLHTPEADENKESHVSSLPHFSEEHAEFGNKDKNEESDVPEIFQESEVESESERDAVKHKLDVEKSQDHLYTPEEDKYEDPHVSDVPHYSEEHVESVNDDQNGKLDIPEVSQPSEIESEPELNTETHTVDVERSQDHLYTPEVDKKEDSNVSDVPHYPEEHGESVTEDQNEESDVPEIYQEFEVESKPEHDADKHEFDVEKSQDHLYTPEEDKYADPHVSDVPHYSEEHVESVNQDQNGKLDIPEVSQPSEIESEPELDADKHAVDVERSQDHSYTPEVDKKEDSYVFDVPHYPEEHVETVNKDENTESRIPEDFQGSQEKSEPEPDTEKHQHDLETSQDQLYTPEAGENKESNVSNLPHFSEEHDESVNQDQNGKLDIPEVSQPSEVESEPEIDADKHAVDVERLQDHLYTPEENKTEDSHVSDIPHHPEEHVETVNKDQNSDSRIPEDSQGSEVKSEPKHDADNHELHVETSHDQLNISEDDENEESHVSNMPHYSEEHVEFVNQDKTEELDVPEVSQPSGVASEPERDADKHEFDVEKSQDHLYTPEEDKKEDSHVSDVPHYSEEHIESGIEDKNEESDVPEIYQESEVESEPERDNDKYEHDVEKSQDHPYTQEKDVYNESHISKLPHYPPEHVETTDNNAADELHLSDTAEEHSHHEHKETNPVETVLLVDNVPQGEDKSEHKSDIMPGAPEHTENGIYDENSHVPHTHETPQHPEDSADDNLHEYETSDPPKVSSQPEDHEKNEQQTLKEAHQPTEDQSPLVPIVTEAAPIESYEPEVSTNPAVVHQPEDYFEHEYTTPISVPTEPYYPEYEREEDKSDDTSISPSEESVQLEEHHSSPSPSEHPEEEEPTETYESEVTHTSHQQLDEDEHPIYPENHHEQPGEVEIEERYEPESPVSLEMTQKPSEHLEDDENDEQDHLSIPENHQDNTNEWDHDVSTPQTVQPEDYSPPTDPEETLGSEYHPDDDEQSKHKVTSAPEATSEPEEHSVTGHEAEHQEPTTNHQEDGHNPVSAQLEHSSVDDVHENENQNIASENAHNQPEESKEENKNTEADVSTQGKNSSHTGSPEVAGEPENNHKHSESTNTSIAHAHCPIAKLNGDQVALVCPCGFRRHPKYCNLFYQCTSENAFDYQITVLSCPESTVFDQVKIQCLPRDKVSEPCTDSDADQNLYDQLNRHSLTTVSVTTTRLCPGVGYYPNQHECSSKFYKCVKNSKGSIEGYVQECPPGHVYWQVSRRCEDAKLFPKCRSE